MDKVYMDEVYGLYMTYLDDFTHKTDNQSKAFLKLARLLAERGNYLEKAISQDDWVGAVLLVRGLSDFTQPQTSELNRVTNELLYIYLERYVQQVPDDNRYEVSLGLLRELNSLLPVEISTLDNYESHIEDYLSKADTFGESYVIQGVNIYFLRDLLDKARAQYLRDNAEPKHQALLYLGTPFKNLLLSVPNLRRELAEFSKYELSFKFTDYVEMFPCIVEQDTEQLLRVVRRLVSQKEPLLDSALKEIFQSKNVPSQTVVNVGNTLNTYNHLENLIRNNVLTVAEQVRSSYLGHLGLAFTNNTFNVKNTNLLLGNDLNAYTKRRERFLSSKLKVFDQEKLPSLKQVRSLTVITKGTTVQVPFREVQLSNQSRILFTPSSMIFVHLVKGNIAQGTTQSLIYTQDMWSSRLSLLEHIQEFEKVVRSKVDTKLPYSALANQIYDLRRR